MGVSQIREASIQGNGEENNCMVRDNRTEKAWFYQVQTTIEKSNEQITHEISVRCVLRSNMVTTSRRYAVLELEPSKARRGEVSR
mmetsp:Transcript_11035/g.33847  ORF Transcript_11035/g.33847 Transcript_11035/m.33847 type:complete len:85 (-) Transcript_11035:152-406(-)